MLVIVVSNAFSNFVWLSSETVYITLLTSMILLLSYQSMYVRMINIALHSCLYFSCEQRFCCRRGNTLNFSSRAGDRAQENCCDPSWVRYVFPIVCLFFYRNTRMITCVDFVMLRCCIRFRDTEYSVWSWVRVTVRVRVISNKSQGGANRAREWKQKNERRRRKKRMLKKHGESKSKTVRCVRTWKEEQARHESKKKAEDESKYTIAEHPR